jgi:hypothetical protein
LGFSRFRVRQRSREDCDAAIEFAGGLVEVRPPGGRRLVSDGVQSHLIPLLHRGGPLLTECGQLFAECR